MAQKGKLKREGCGEAYEAVGRAQVLKEDSFSISKLKGKLKIELKANVKPERIKTEIADDIHRGKHRLAVDKAKCYHNTIGNADSRECLLFAYQGRISHMLDQGMAFEADQLLEVVEGKFPAERGHFDSLRQRLAFANGQLDSILSQLKAADRSQLEHINILIRQNCKDLAGIINSKVLAADHPLRRAATAAQDAFAKVTSRQVSEDEIFLPEISHRSPLLDWKLLIRGIAYFYQGENGKSLEQIDKIDASAAVRKLGEVVRAMLRDEAPNDLSKACGLLVSEILNEYSQLIDAVTALDEALEGDDDALATRCVSKALSFCRQFRPDFKTRLMQHISVRAMMCDVTPEPILAGFGKDRVLREAYYWRLFARGLEAADDAFYACAAWEEFRRHALNEKWFTPDSAEEAAVFLHMADVIRGASDDFLEEMQEDFEEDFRGFGHMYQGQPDWVMRAMPTAGQRKDFYYIYPEQLFERAFSAFPTRELFTKWISYTSETSGDYRDMEKVALRWHETIPENIEPLLVLAKAADKRNAYNKALKYLDTAEELDKINPEVKWMRFRLQVSKTMRHLRDFKSNLVEKDLAELEDLPQIFDGDRPAMLGALRLFLYRSNKDTQAEQQEYNKLVDFLGNNTAVDFLLFCLTREYNLYYNGTGSKVRLNLKKATDPVGTAGRICRLGQEMGFAVDIPEDWPAVLGKELGKKRNRFDPQILKALAESAYKNLQWLLLFDISGAGLRNSGKYVPEFLIYRAQSLGFLDRERSVNCLKCAAVLAQRQSEPELVEKAIDALKRISPFGGFGTQQMVPDENFIQKVITKELKAKKPQQQKREVGRRGILNRFKSGALDFGRGECQCPECRRARAEAAKPKQARKKKSPKDVFSDDEPLLFDDMEDYLIDEPNDGPEDETEDDFDTIPSLPTIDKDSPEAKMALKELLDFCNGRLPQRSDLDRLAFENPGLAMKLLMLVNGVGPDGLDDDDCDDDIDFGDFSPFGKPKVNRSEKRRNRKKERKNRKRNRK